MAKLSLKVATTSKIVRIFINNNSVVTGAGLAGLVYNSAGLTCYYIKEGQGSATAVTLVTAAVGTWTSSGFKEIDATNMPGWYELGLPNAALSTGASVSVHLQGATNMVPVPLEIELTANDNQTAITAANITQVDGASLTSHGSGKLPADVLMLDSAAIGSHTAGYFPVDNVGSGLKKNQAFTAMPFVMRDAATKLPATGFTVSVKRMIDAGGSFATGGLNTVVDAGDGGYTVNGIAGDANGKYITFLATATGADPTLFTVITVP